MADSRRLMLTVVHMAPDTGEWLAEMLGMPDMDEDEMRDYLTPALLWQRDYTADRGGSIIVNVPDC